MMRVKKLSRQEHFISFTAWLLCFRNRDTNTRPPGIAYQVSPKRTSRVDQPVAFKQNFIHIKSLRRILQFQSPDFSNYFYQLIIQCINLNCPNISDGMNHCCLKLGVSETAVQIGTHRLFCKYWNTATLNSLTYCLWLFSHYSGRAEWL